MGCGGRRLLQTFGCAGASEGRYGDPSRRGAGAADLFARKLFRICTHAGLSGCRIGTMTITAKDGTYNPELDNTLAVRWRPPVRGGCAGGGSGGLVWRSARAPLLLMYAPRGCVVLSLGPWGCVSYGCLQIEAQCDVTGSGAVNSATCWNAQLTLCGAKECDPKLLPPFGAPGAVSYDPGR